MQIDSRVIGERIFVSDSENFDESFQQGCVRLAPFPAVCSLIRALQMLQRGKMPVKPRREFDWWTQRKGFAKVELISDVLLECLLVHNLLRCYGLSILMSSSGVKGEFEHKQET